jgi:radical SAM-linked protein
MAEQPRFRAIVTYAKMGSARYLSHRELLRAMDRAVRRAGLGVQYSQGFSPRAQLSFPPPLPVGAEGTAELFSIELAQRADADAIRAALAPEMVALPVSCVTVEPRIRKSPWTELTTASYVIEPTWAPDITASALRRAVAETIAADELVIDRQTKRRVRTIDIRPNIHLLEASDGKTLIARLGITEDMLVKPDEIVAVLGARLGVEGDWRRLVRTGLQFEPDTDGPVRP